jgi:flagellin-specific chaperone FliS
MFSIPVITLLIVLLAALVCYAFIYQTISYRKRQRDRLLDLLKLRLRNFKFMLNGFPPGFLTKELSLLVHRSLVQVLDQLAKMEPNGKHREEIPAIEQHMAEIQRQPNAKSVMTGLENIQKVRDIKASLEDLYKYVHQLQSQKTLSSQQAESYRAMINQLVVQLSVDSYFLQGRMAKDKGKLRLAVHFFNLALKLMEKGRNKSHFESRIQQVQTLITELESRLSSDEPQAVKVTENADSATGSSEWDKFGQEQPWKKKQLYD